MKGHSGCHTFRSLWCLAACCVCGPPAPTPNATPGLTLAPCAPLFCSLGSRFNNCCACLSPWSLWPRGNYDIYVRLNAQSSCLFVIFKAFGWVGSDLAFMPRLLVAVFLVPSGPYTCDIEQRLESQSRGRGTWSWIYSAEADWTMRETRRMSVTDEWLASPLIKAIKGLLSCPSRDWHTVSSKE